MIVMHVICFYACIYIFWLVLHPMTSWPRGSMEFEIKWQSDKGFSWRLIVSYCNWLYKKVSINPRPVIICHRTINMWQYGQSCFENKPVLSLAVKPWYVVVLALQKTTKTLKPMNCDLYHLTVFCTQNLYNCILFCLDTY
jgi:hypothetical protein